MLTARTEVSERVAGLEAGADDYLAKPFAREELIARLRALLRRTGWEGDEQLLRFEDLELDPLAHEARRGGRLLELTRTEFLLLELLMRHPRQVLTRATIFDRVWGYDFGPASNSLEVYIGYLRRKTEAGGEPRLVHTVRGVGYVLRARAMSFRRRMVLLAAGAVAAAVVLASVVVYVRHAQRAARPDRRQPAPEAHARAAAGGPDPDAPWLRAELAKLKREGKLPPLRVRADRRSAPVERRQRRASWLLARGSRRRSPAARARPRAKKSSIERRVTAAPAARTCSDRRSADRQASREAGAARAEAGRRQRVRAAPPIQRQGRCAPKARDRCSRSPPPRVRSPPAGATPSSATPPSPARTCGY